MKPEIKDGGPAFPRPASEYEMTGDSARESHCGMTLRDYFAGKALPVCIADALKDAENGGREADKYDYLVAANEAFSFADAMISIRSIQVAMDVLIDPKSQLPKSE